MNGVLTCFGVRMFIWKINSLSGDVPEEQRRVARASSMLHLALQSGRRCRLWL
jgi:hypothetical protein